MIVSLLHGGRDFAGISGRRTASAGETNAIETNVIAAAHFILHRLIKLRSVTSKSSRFGNHPNVLRTTRSTRLSFAIQRFRLFFRADATVYLSCAQRAGRFG